MIEPELETAVKLHIYATLAETGKAPDVRGAAHALGAPLPDVEAAWASLHAKRLLVPEPGAPGRLRMAPPFSGIETAFRVRAKGRGYFANCAWDALGIPAALHEDAVIRAEDGHTREPMTLEVRSGRPVPEACVIHFAVPAVLWWKDIIHT